MRQKIFLYLLSALLVINLVALGSMLFHRWSGPKCSPGAMGRGLEQLKKELSLSAEQVSKMRSFQSAFHSELDVLSAKILDERKRLVELLEQEEPSSARLEGVVEDINRLQLEAQKKVAAQLLAVKSVLTREQQKKFFKIVLERLCLGPDQGGPGRYLRGT